MIRLKNNYLLLFNLLLALVFGFRLVTLLNGLTSSGKSARQVEASSPVEIKKQKVELLATYRPLFVLKKQESSEKKDEKANTTIREIKIDQGVVRLQGIFITDEDRSAVFSFVEKGKRGSVKKAKYSVGEELYNYEVVAIDLSSVTLAKEGAHPVVLRIFSQD